MNRLELTVAAVIFGILASSGNASGPGYIFDDPEVIPPANVFVPCPPNSGRPGKLVKPGHEAALCKSDPKPKAPPKPPTECSSLWTPGTLLANNRPPKKDCA